METPSKDPFSSFCEGAGKQCAEEGISFVKKILNQITNRKYLFIGERKTIDHVKRQSNEFNFYSKYLINSDFKFQIKMGLALRSLDEEKDYDRMDHLKKVIRKKFNVEGLHISQLSQNKIIMKYILHYLEEDKDEEEIKTELDLFLKEIEKNTFFIQKENVADDVINDVSIKIKVNSPRIFVLSTRVDISYGDFKKIFDFFMANPLHGYTVKRYTGEGDILFFYKIA